MELLRIDEQITVNPELTEAYLRCRRERHWRENGVRKLGLDVGVYLREALTRIANAMIRGNSVLEHELGILHDAAVSPGFEHATDHDAARRLMIAVYHAIWHRFSPVDVDSRAGTIHFRFFGQHDPAFEEASAFTERAAITRASLAGADSITFQSVIIGRRDPDRPDNYLSPLTTRYIDQANQAWWTRSYLDATGKQRRVTAEPEPVPEEELPRWVAALMSESVLPMSRIGQETPASRIFPKPFTLYDIGPIADSWIAETKAVEKLVERDRRDGLLRLIGTDTACVTRTGRCEFYELCHFDDKKLYVLP